MTVLQTQYHLVCNTDKTQRAHVSKGQDWENNIPAALLEEEQDVHRR